MESEDTKLALRTIGDCFSGADGAAAYVRLRRLVDRMETDAEAGDAAAKEVLAVVHRFARLIRVANGGEVVQ